MSLKQKMQINFFADFRNNVSYFLRAQNFVMIEEKTMKLEGGRGGVPHALTFLKEPILNIILEGNNILTGRLLVVYFPDSLNFS